MLYVESLKFAVFIVSNVSNKVVQLTKKCLNSNEEEFQIQRYQLCPVLPTRCSFINHICCNHM